MFAKFAGSDEVLDARELKQILNHVFKGSKWRGMHSFILFPEVIDSYVNTHLNSGAATRIVSNNNNVHITSVALKSSGDLSSAPKQRGQFRIDKQFQL